jgi:proline dehydrogenase
VLLDRAIVKLLPAVPRPVVQRLSSRYIAGPTLDDAMRVVRRLGEKGKLATIDVLGEEIRSADESRAIARQYHDVLARLDEEALDGSISIKLTALGLDLDVSCAARTSSPSWSTPPRAGGSSASTWRTRRRPTGRSRSTASCATAATRT